MRVARRLRQDRAPLRHQLGIDSFFAASHRKRPHGERHSHSFRLQALIAHHEINADGMLVGFREASDLLETEAKPNGNQDINEVPPFVDLQATGENIATVLFPAPALFGCH